MTSLFALTRPMPCLSFNHGSGRGSGVGNFLRKYAKSLPRPPTGIVVAEAHLVHLKGDTVKIAGTAQLAAKVAAHLGTAGIRSQILNSNSWNSAHGFADVKRVFEGTPVVMISVPSNNGSASASLALGRALAPLRKHGVLIMGSGVPSFHNFSLLKRSLAAQRQKHCLAFVDWLDRTLAMGNVEEREKVLSSWQSAPSAGPCHPGTDSHFSPTLVCAGASLSTGRPVHAESHREILPMAGPIDWSTMRHFEFL